MSCQCPLCYRSYSQLSQHLKVSHKVRNVDERRLLLALESGRVNVRKGRCPVAGCNKETSRLDRHLRRHSELTAKARRVAFADCKKAKVIRDLAVLRASNPVVPMVSAFDLEEEGAAAPEGEEEREEDEDEHDCTERCKRQKTRLKGLVSDLNKQVDALSSALQEVTRRCKRLIRRPSAHQTQQVKDVTTKLLKALEDPAEEDAATPAVTSPPRSPESRLSTSRATEAEHLGERSPAHFPDHVAVLSEFRGLAFSRHPPVDRLSR